MGRAVLHAGVAVPGSDRRRVERLCRYVARPPLALDRLEAMADGRLAYRLKTRWRDGTTHVVMERHELLERLAPTRKLALPPTPAACASGPLSRRLGALCEWTKSSRPVNGRPGGRLWRCERQAESSAPAYDSMGARRARWAGAHFAFGASSLYSSTSPLLPGQALV